MQDSYFSFLQSWSSQHIEVFLFYFIVLLAIPLAYGVLFDRRIIRSGFLLIGVFGMISGLFLLLQAQFLAMAQLMIYAVGITLVVVIALMLTNPRLESEPNYAIAVPTHKLPAVLAAIAVFVTIYLGLRSEPWQINTTPMDPTHNVAQLGLSLLRYYSMPFEFASVLLLIALVGAIMLAKHEGAAQAEQWFEDTDENEVHERSQEVAQV